MSSKTTARREFLQATGAAFTTSLFTGNVRGANDRLSGAFIGVGVMGTENLKAAMKQQGVEVGGGVRRVPAAPGAGRARSRGAAAISPKR